MIGLLQHSSRVLVSSLRLTCFGNSAGNGGVASIKYSSRFTAVQGVEFFTNYALGMVKCFLNASPCPCDSRGSFAHRRTRPDLSLAPSLAAHALRSSRPLLSLRAQGGALHVGTGVETAVTDATFYGNSAQQLGAAFAHDGLANPEFDRQCSFARVRFDQNSAQGSGAAVSLANNDACSFVDSEFNGNQAAVRDALLAACISLPAHAHALCACVLCCVLVCAVCL